MAKYNTNIHNPSNVFIVDQLQMASPGRPAPPDNHEEDDAPPENPVCEQEVVDKVSNLLKTDYLQNGKFDCNPCKPQQIPLKDLFVKPFIQHIDYTFAFDSPGEGGVSMNEIFSPHDGSDSSVSPSRVLIYGNSFTGKSILCQKYAQDWANQDPSSPLGKFKVVIFLKLCDVKGTFEEIIETHVFRKQLTQVEKTKFFRYMNQHPDQFLFILDGISECNLEELHDIEKFLLDKGHGRFFVIATTRLEVQDCRKLCKTFHSRYRICGYNKQDVLDYVSKYFRHDKAKCDELKEYLENDKDLMELAKTPLIAMIICELWQEKDKLLTITQVLSYYTSMVIKLIKLQENLSALEDLAIRRVTKTKEEFGLEELSQCKVDRKNGFLNEELGKESFVFAHTRVLEYLEARWIIRNCKMEGLIDWLVEKSLPPSVCLFLAGLLAENNDERLFQFLKELTKSSFFQESCCCNRMDLFLACSAEAWNERNCKEILNICAGIEPFKSTKTPNNFPLVMSRGAAQGLGYIVPKLQLTALNLSGIIISHPEAKIIASKCFHKRSKLKSVKFSHSCLSSNSVQVICEALAEMLKLEEVDLSLCSLGTNGLKAVANLILKAKGELKSLHLVEDLNENHLKKEEIPHAKPDVARQISFSDISKLHEFQEEYKNDPPTEESIMALIDAVKDENDLKDISLPPSCVGDLISKWFDVFRENATLERIKIYLPELNDSLQEQLVTLVNEMSQLIKISVFLVNEESDYSTYCSLEQRNEGKIKLTILDHTHSVSHPLKAFARSVISESPHVVTVKQSKEDCHD